MPNSLYRIVYISHSTLPEEALKEELHKIHLSSSKNNALKQISGQLIYCHHLFVQTLEGQFEKLSSLIKTIEQDPRHSGITVIFSGKIASRDHPDWSQMEVISDASKLAKFKKYIESIAALPLNTISASQTKGILYLLSSINDT